MNLYPSPKHPLTDFLKGDSQEFIRESSIKSNFQVFRASHPIVWNNFTDGEIDELLIKTQLNNFQVNKFVGIFPHFCLFNQACDPNVSIWYSRNMVMLLAKREIKKGEEVFVHYVSLDQDKPTRKARLVEYGFDCNCVRCSEQGEWKEKEAKLNGIKCPECGIEIACNEEKRFKCPKGHWESDYTYYEGLEKVAKEFIFEMRNKPEENDVKKLEEFLKTIEKQFSDYHINRVVALDALAQIYASKKEEKEFIKCYSEIVKMIEFYPYPELLIILNNLLIEIVDSFQRDPSDKELYPLVYFGLPLEAVTTLWKEFVDQGREGWILHF